MKDVAIYKEKTGKGDLSNIITVFSFSQEAQDKVMEAVISGNLIVTSMSQGNKPGSLRTKIQTTKEHFNNLLTKGA